MTLHLRALGTYAGQQYHCGLHSDWNALRGTLAVIDHRGTIG